MKKCIYTCIIGMYDFLIQPGHVNEDFDYICFTNQIIKDPGVWEIRPLPDVDDLEDLNLINRYVKMHPHILLKEYDLTIYIDGNVYIQDDVNEILNKYHNDFIVYKHHFGNDYYREVKRCIKQKKDVMRKITNQYHHYTLEGFDGGILSYNGILIRKNNDTTQRINELWYNEIITKSKRDQLALPYIVWKYNINEVKYLDFVDSKKYFFITTHNRFDINAPVLGTTYNKDQKVALCCVTFSENQFVKDFIDHYRKLGVNHIFIYDCNENSNIKTNVDENYVTVIKWKYKDKITEVIEAYEDCYKNHLNDYDWCCFFNINEFLEIPHETSINKYLAHTEFDDRDTIFVNWGIIDEKSSNINFYMRKENRFFKSICRCNKETVKWEESHTIHMPMIDENLVTSSSGSKSFIFNYDGFIKYYRYDNAMLIMYPYIMSDSQLNFYNNIFNYI